MEDLSLERFAAQVGQAFQVRAPDGTEASFELAEVRDLGAAMDLPAGHRRPFSLLFRAPEDVTWRHGTFTFQHDALGEMAAFCSAIVDPAGHGRHAYEVIFA